MFLCTVIADPLSALGGRRRSAGCSLPIVTRCLELGESCRAAVPNGAIRLQMQPAVSICSI